jgi:hypothetical protein
VPASHVRRLASRYGVELESDAVNARRANRGRRLDDVDMVWVPTQNPLDQDVLSLLLINFHRICE